MTDEVSFTYKVATAVTMNALCSGEFDISSRFNVCDMIIMFSYSVLVIDLSSGTGISVVFRTNFVELLCHRNAASSVFWIQNLLSNVRDLRVLGLH